MKTNENILNHSVKKFKNFSMIDCSKEKFEGKKKEEMRKIKDFQKTKDLLP